MSVREQIAMKRLDVTHVETFISKDKQGGVVPGP